MQLILTIIKVNLLVQKTDSISTNSSDSLVSEKSNQLGRKLMYAINTGEFPLNDHFFLQSNFFSFNTIEGGSHQTWTYLQK